MSATAALMKSKKGEAKEPAPKDSETKDAAKHGAKGKAVVKGSKDKAAPVDVLKATQTPKAQVIPSDDISKAATEIENLKSAEVATKMAHALYDGVEFDLFKLGGVLTVVQDKGWYEPYASFRDYVEGEFSGLKYRKALYLIEIYNSLLEAGIEFETVKAVGWTKLKEIAPILTAKNVAKWVKKAMKLKTIQLIEEVREVKKGIAGKVADAGAEVAKVSTKTFKLHADQRAVIDEALQKARLEVDTEHDAVAFEQVCLSYLSGPKKKAGSAMPEATDFFKHMLAKHDGNKEEALQDVFAGFDKVFVGVDVELSMK